MLKRQRGFSSLCILLLWVKTHKETFCKPGLEHAVQIHIKILDHLRLYLNSQNKFLQEIFSYSDSTYISTLIDCNVLNSIYKDNPNLLPTERATSPERSQHIFNLRNSGGIKMLRSHSHLHRAGSDNMRPNRCFSVLFVYQFYILMSIMYLHSSTENFM